MKIEAAATHKAGCTYEQSANCSINVVSFASLVPSFWKTDLGMRLMLAPGSHKALPTYWFPIDQGGPAEAGAAAVAGSSGTAAALGFATVSSPCLVLGFGNNFTLQVVMALHYS
ncbi:hypothetical protein V6N13_005002 [Hibiscus sabdariffa]